VTDSTQGGGPTPGRAKRLASFLGRWWGGAISGPLAFVLIGIAGLTTNGHYSLLRWHEISTSATFVALAAIAALGGTFETTRKIRQLQGQLDRAVNLGDRATAAELALIETVCDELRSLVDSLRLFSDGRASLFLCREDHFVLVGRYSPMPTFSRSVGRDIYPLQQGVLGEAWREGQAEDPDLPNPGPTNAAPHRGWLERQARDQIDETTASMFTMRSRSYAAIRLEYERHRLGVLVVEDTRPAAETPASEVADNNPGGSLAALTALAKSNEVRVLSRALRHLHHLESAAIRSRVVDYLPVSR
jgi:hypothetical protein